MKPITRIALVVNAQKTGAHELGKMLTHLCAQAGVESRLTTSHPVERDFLKGMDACCVLGGDGTLLSAVPESMAHRVPVFGINQGKLGFLATLSVEESEWQFKRILAGEYIIEERSTLHCTSAGGEEAFAFNDVVLKSPDSQGLIGLRVTCDEELVTDYWADGLIFCTSTGSTAYNLSAGGPIVHPHSNVITMTPICAHTLTNRSMIFPSRSRLAVNCSPRGKPPIISVDGNLAFHGCRLPLSIRRADTTVPLLQPPNHSHFRILRSKLMWGGEESIDPGI
ncbi:NAD(+)/NADH kinase [Ruficoccus amylovorans]|uniref:NAD kinase n=1 Tax=Ruficoccus amylovorans TaxID=1804625 RepID=A0A842HH83_9BACT|nr:NAD(+)/NADH kinase [Ruficoccus amylovorans]MBC2595358.1 NAD(+)/NADH kinase [Ruficoccus amylovorans]